MSAPEQIVDTFAVAVPPTDVAHTLTATDCVAVQPFALVMVIVPFQIPAVTPAGITTPVNVPPSAANAKDVLPWSVRAAQSMLYDIGLLVVAA